MKKKTILGVALTLMLLGSLVGASVPASAGTLSWTTVTIPSDVSYRIISSNVTDIAVYDADTIYAGVGDNYIYKSTDGGVTWARYATDADTDLVAVAADDSEYVVYADNATYTVYISDDGGSSFDSLGVPGSGTAADATGGIRDIAISAAKAGKHYVAVGGTDNSTAGNVWYYAVGATAPAWSELHDNPGYSTVNGTDVVAAVAFSPNFPSDEVMVALTETDAGEINLEMYSFDSSKWNAEAGFLTWPVALVDNDGISDLNAGSITLDPDYLGSDDAMRMVFVGLDIAGDADAIAYNGIYRADDTLTKAIKDGATVRIYSVAFNGSNLVAGESDTNTTYYSADPTATTPTVSATSSYKRPGVSTNTATVVAWAGDNAVAGTYGDESAFSISRNDGKSYNDVALIDTTLANKSDVAVSPDGSTVYMVTDDGTNASVFRQASAWERVLTVAGKTGLIVRLAPDDPDVVYVAERGGTTIYYSADGGETRWQLRSCGVAIQDLAVEGTGDVLYALRASDGKVTQSTNSGFTWGLPKSTKLSGGNVIVSLGEDKLLVGSDDGYVSFTSDYSTWTKIEKQIETGGGNVQATASGLASGDFIYAAAVGSTVNIRRWEIGESVSWTKIKEGVSGNVTGIVLDGKVLYAMVADGGDSVAYRTTNATLDPTVYWSEMASTANFTAAPHSFAMSAGSNKLWAVDNKGLGTSSTPVVSDVFYSYTDTLIDAAPTLNSPKQDFVVKINPVTGRANQVTFVWERPSDEVEAYDLWIAFDSGFDEVVKTFSIEETGTPISAVVGPEAGNALEWMNDTTYFWKVRVSTPIKSQWSEVRRFTIEKATVTPPVIVEPTPPAPPPPEITVEVPPPTKVEIPPAPPAPAPIAPAYIWAVIIIGAILVIALIVLIVRTRRVP